jgi:thioester reductase-like protein
VFEPIATDMIGAMEQDVRLADGLAFPSGAPPAQPAEILLTGATGFLGGEIAAALLRATGARLHCLVRDRPGLPARERLGLIRRRLEVDAARLVLVEGDLGAQAAAGDHASPALSALAEQVDTVVHCAAAVNLFAPYEALRGSNVLAARAVLGLAARGRAKAVHFVSTVGVFLSPHYRGRTIAEEMFVQGAEGLRNGYAQSKWVADTMMARASARGLRVTVYRPGFVGWHSETGRAGEHDIVALLLVSSLQAGCAPHLDLQINSTPVDHVADTVARIACAPAAQGGPLHVVNRAAVRFVDLAAMARLPLVPLAEWERAVATKVPQMAKVAALVCRSQDDPASGSEELHLAHNRIYDDTRLQRALGAAYRPPLPYDARYLSTFIKRLVGRPSI